MDLTTTGSFFFFSQISACVGAYSGQVDGRNGFNPNWACFILKKGLAAFGAFQHLHPVYTRRLRQEPPSLSLLRPDTERRMALSGNIPLRGSVGGLDDVCIYIY